MRIRHIRWLGIIILTILWIGIGYAEKSFVPPDAKLITILKGHKSSITSIAFSPDGKYMATGSKDTTTKVWLVGDWYELIALRGHVHGVIGVAFSLDGNYLSSVSKTGRTLAWEVGTWYEEEDKVTEFQSIAYNSFSFSPGLKYLATKYADTAIKVWEISSLPEPETAKLISENDIDKLLLYYYEESQTGIQHEIIKNVLIKKGIIGSLLGLHHNKKYSYKNVKLRLKEREERKEREKRALPAELVISDLQFQDNNSFCYHDKILNAGEKANIEFMLKNEGKGIGFEAVFEIKSNIVEIDVLSFQKKIGDVQPGETKKLTIPIKADLALRNGEAAFLIQAKEKRGYHSQKVKLAIQTSALIPPKLEIKSVEINDGNIGQARGNGNGIPENNETVELIAYVKNSGQGDALGVDLAMDSINSGLEVIKQKTNMGIIHPGQTVKGKLIFSIPRTFKADQLKYELKVNDVRGADSQKRQFALKFQRLVPVLAYDYQVYDGNSTNSKGNKNGTVENGETLEIVIIPRNTGDLEANRVTVSLEPPHSLSLNKNKASVGTILAHDSGDKKSFILPVPRTFQQDKITLNLIISQADFPSLNQSLELKTKIIRPRLTFTHRVTGNIMQGDTPVLEVVVRNEGKLDAHGVGVSVNIDTKGINLPTKQKSWGRLPAGASTDSLRFPFTIMRSADPGELPIKINLTQTDFPSATKTLAFNIQEEGVLEVAVEGRQAPVYSRPVRRSYNEPPSIRIVSPFNNDKTFRPEIELEARIVDDKEVSRIVVKLNGRQLLDDNFRGITVKRKSGSLTHKRVFKKLKLASGENRITVIAYDNENQISQETITVSYHKEKGEIWAVLIGVSNYQNPSLKLNYCANDARAMKEYLVNDFGVAEDHVTMLLDQDATRERMMKELGTKLRKNAGKEDQVIIYFAGHGAPEQDVESPDGDGFEKYLLPYDVDIEDLYTSALPMREIRNIFRRIKAKRLVFLADACFSGASGGDLMGMRAAPISEKFWERISGGKGRVIISASSAKEVSAERKELKHGVFTYYLLEGLRGKADLDGDGLIDTEEVYRYVSKKVPAATGQQQNPIKKGEVKGQIILGRVK